MMLTTTLEALALEKMARYAQEAAVTRALARPSLRERLARTLYAAALRLDANASYRTSPQLF